MDQLIARHTHTHTHTGSHQKQTPTHTHTHIRTNKHTNTHTDTHRLPSKANTHRNRHRHTHTYTLTHTYTHTRIHTDTLRLPSKANTHRDRHRHHTHEHTHEPFHRYTPAPIKSKQGLSTSQYSTSGISAGKCVKINLYIRKRDQHTYKNKPIEKSKHNAEHQPGLWLSFIGRQMCQKRPIYKTQRSIYT